MTAGDRGRRHFQALLRIRMVEERIIALYPEQEMRCPTHFSIGQEAVAVGVLAQLSATEPAMSAHRSHAHYLAKGGDLRAMFAELYGKATGCARGKGGSMHLIDRSAGFLGCVPIVGSTIPIAVGAALGARLKGTERLTAVFFGDGAVETGVFHESLNYAAQQRLPVLFVCENNLYSVNTDLADRQPTGRPLTQLAASHGIMVASGDGQDVVAVHDVAHPAIAHVRGGHGPAFLEFATYRWLEHCGPQTDLHLGFRPEGEYDAWTARDPVALCRQVLIAAGVLTESDIEDMRSRIATEIDDAVAFAKSSPFPARVELMRDVYPAAGQSPDGDSASASQRVPARLPAA